MNQDDESACMVSLALFCLVLMTRHVFRAGEEDDEYVSAMMMLLIGETSVLMTTAWLSRPPRA